MKLNKDFIFISVFSIIYSLIEIELEGKSGWMKNIPTANIIKICNKHMTLYHIYMLLLIITIFFYKSKINNFKDIILIFTYILLVLFLEDILWFVFNPYYTIKKYTKKDIWWHSDQLWICGIPMMNIIIFSLLYISYIITSNKIIISNAVSSLILIFGCILIAPCYHKFYLKTHK